MEYRRDIDGLRAVAILLVLFFHCGWAWMPSGFIGVDIFFVISGYLITRIINTAIDNHAFSIRTFYVRRLWRIQPALLAVTAVSLLIGWMCYLSPDFVDLAKSAAYTTVFLSNRFFAGATTAYAAPDSAYMLLLHTWSLSIEWQWYLLLPLFMVALKRFCSDRLFKWVVLLATLAMAGFLLYASWYGGPRNYYAFACRACEFMVGGSLAILLSRVALPRMAATLAGGGALAILLGISLCNGLLAGYPDWVTLVVCLASAVVILAGSSPDNVVSRFLSWSPMVFLGVISYSLYLWHWPVFASARYLGFLDDGQGGSSLPVTLVCLALTFCLGCVSYVAIERPLRKWRYPFAVTVLCLVVVPAVLAGGLYYAAKKHDGFSERFGSQYSRIVKVLNDSASDDRKKCIHQKDYAAAEKQCRLGDTEGARSALMIGDSHANHYWNFMDVLARDAHLDVRSVELSSCMALPDVYQYKANNERMHYASCREYARYFYHEALQHGYDFVIIGQIWPAYLDDRIVADLSEERSVARSREHIRTAFGNALDMIVRSGATPVVVRTVQKTRHAYMACLYRDVKLGGRMTQGDVGDCVGQWDAGSVRWLDRLFSEMKARYPQLIVIDPKDVQCTDGRCLQMIDGIPVYRDDEGHLTDFAAGRLGEMYLAEKGNPFGRAMSR